MAKTDPNLLTQAEYARSRKERGLPGGSREAVRKAVEEGRIRAFGTDKLVDLELADAQWERNTRARVSPGSGAAAGQPMLPMPDLPGADAYTPPAAAPLAVAQDPTYMQLRARRELADAEMAEMNAAKMRGAMVLREDVDRAHFEIGREIRDALTACARRVAAEVSSVSSAEACESVIDREHRIVLELLVTSLREKVGARPGGVA